ncbi:MAG: hypothetical protein ACXABG_12335 [Promethearchaeota archaeon]|jgi:hypothetical protein
MLTEAGVEKLTRDVIGCYHGEFRDIMANVFDENTDLTTEEIAEIIKKDLEGRTEKLYKNYEYARFAMILRAVFRKLDNKKLAEDLQKSKESYALF